MYISNIEQLKYSHKRVLDKIAVCKKTNKGFLDYKNISGVLSKHLKSLDIIQSGRSGGIDVDKYFNLIDSNILDSSKIECKICNKVFKNNKSGGLTNHIIKIHNIQILDYIDKFPDQKEILDTNIKSNKLIGDFHCTECSKKFKNINSLSKHLSRTHKISTSQYYREKLYNNEPQYCKCGCGTEVNFDYSSNHLHKERKYYPDYVQGHCPNPTTSKEESEIFSYLESLGIYNIKTKNRSLLKGLELDIYLPDYKVAIEFNGTYWHSEKLGKDRNYHLNKKNKCKELGIDLITIWDIDWRDKKEIIQNVIKSRLGFNKKLYARNCTVKEITNTEYRNFIITHHIQGYTNSQYKFGLYYNNELIQVIGFSNIRKFIDKKDAGYELIRLCTKFGYSVIGGANKLLKYFKDKFNPNKIISYCNLDYFSGSVYLKMGMVQENNSPSYFYVKNGKKIGRYSLRKSELIKMGYDKNKTSSEILNENTYLKVWTCGTLKFNLCYTQQ